MDFNDFAEEFDTVYICRKYEKENGWSSLLLEDKWVGEYAQGLPTRENRGAVTEKNPQYGITM